MAQNEIQTIDLHGSPSGGTFRIEFDGDVTSTIAYNASAATVDTALEALSTIGPSNISVTGGPLPGSTLTCEFTGSLAETNVVPMTVQPDSLTGGSISASISETQAGFGSLATGITEYWTLDESSGTRYGSYNSRNLTVDWSSPGSTTGVQGSAASLAGDTLRHPSSLLALSTIESDFTFACWVNLPSVFDTYAIAEGRTTQTSPPWSTYTRWRLAHYYTGNSRFVFQIFPYESVSQTSVFADTFGTPSASTYYFLCVRYDSSAKEMSIRVNGTADDTAVISGTPTDLSGAHSFFINNNADSFDIDEMGHWGRRLSDAEVDQLYNSGSGVTYPLPGGQNTIHQLSISGSPASGSLGLTYGPDTATIAYNASSSAIESALEALTTIGSGNVSVSGGDLPGTAIDIEYIGSFANSGVALPILDDGNLKYTVTTTQVGSPTPSQASASWSAGPFVYSAIGVVASASWTSGDVTASGNPEQATGTWSTSSLQSPGIPSSTLPTAQWSSGTVSSAVLTQAAATWSAGTPILTGVFSGPAIAKWRAVQFAALPDNPVIASWSTSEIELDNNPVDVPTATWSSSNAIATAVVDGDPTATWSTGELTTDLNLGLPTAAWSSATLSPSLSQPSTQWTVPGSIGVRLISAPAYVGTTTFRIIDQNLQVVSLEGESVTIPSLTSGSLTIPQFTGQSIAAPGLTSGSLIS